MLRLTDRSNRLKKKDKLAKKVKLLKNTNKIKQRTVNTNKIRQFNKHAKQKKNKCRNLTNVQ